MSETIGSWAAEKVSPDKRLWEVVEQTVLWVNECFALLSTTEISASYSMRSQIQACRRFCLPRLTLLLYLPPEYPKSLNSEPNSFCRFSHSGEAQESIPHVGASDSITRPYASLNTVGEVRKHWTIAQLLK
jgi:hypothetical protein